MLRYQTIVQSLLGTTTLPYVLYMWVNVLLGSPCTLKVRFAYVVMVASESNTFYVDMIVWAVQQQ